MFNRADAIPGARTWFLVLVALAAVLVGFAAAMAEANLILPQGQGAARPVGGQQGAAGPGQAGQNGAKLGQGFGKPPNPQGLKVCLTLYGAAYLTAYFLFRSFGAAGDLELLRRGSGRYVAVVHVIGSVMLIANGWQAVQNALTLSPALVVGLALIGVAVWDGWFARSRGFRANRNSSLSALVLDVQGPVVPPPPARATSAGEVLPLARYEAFSRKQEFVGTQHLLLALARLTDRPAGQVLVALGATEERLRAALLPHLQPCPAAVPADGLPVTPAARDAFKQAQTAARACGLERAEPEHLLIVMLTDPESIASDALIGLGISPERIRKALAQAPAAPEHS